MYHGDTMSEASRNLSNPSRSQAGATHGERPQQNRLALRRKLLRGSLAAPVVLTVSAASTAAAASFTRCLKATGWTEANFFTAGEDGLWYRKPVEVSQLANNAVSQGWYFLDQNLQVWVNIDNISQKQAFGAILPTGWTVTETNTRWALVWFDKRYGTQYAKITVQQPSNQFYPASMSCYGSFNGA
jgi:hypothetical protein